VSEPTPAAPPTGLRPDYPLQTARLDLRPHRRGDLDDLFAFHSSPDVTRYTPWPVRTREQTAAALETKLGQGELTAPGQWLVLAMELRSSRRVVGEVLLKWESGTHQQGEIGAAIAAEHQRSGLGLEAATAVLTLGFDSLRLHRITAQLIAANRPSASVLAALGMRHEGTLRDAVAFEGGWADEELWAITAPEWRRRHTAGADVAAGP
jgi:RimJ/RimL family protein N-acetyltransferase